MKSEKKIIFLFRYMKILLVDQLEIREKRENFGDDFFRIRTGNRFGPFGRKLFDRIELNLRFRFQFLTNVRIRMTIDAADLNQIVLNERGSMSENDETNELTNITASL